MKLLPDFWQTPLTGEFAPEWQKLLRYVVPQSGVHVAEQFGWPVLPTLVSIDFDVVRMTAKFQDRADATGTVYVENRKFALPNERPHHRTVRELAISLADAIEAATFVMPPGDPDTAEWMSLSLAFIYEGSFGDRTWGLVSGTVYDMSTRARSARYG